MRPDKRFTASALIFGVTLVGAALLAPPSGRPVPLSTRFAHINAAREARYGTGEESRNGLRTLAAEQVANRAYPRGYVDDRQAKRSRQAFDQVHNNGTGASRWKALGPVTPNVSGESSQFFDPTTLHGPTTQESGRVTALAIEPGCHAGACRLWVAAAGGGIWRTNNALATHVSWIAPPDSLPTNAFGSIVYDAAHRTLYAGSGEPNGSGDSEAGLGLFKSTDFGAHWTLVPGSASVATSRSIGAIAVDPTNPNILYIGTDVARHGSSAVNGGRKTPPDAPTLGVYRSTDGGAHFTLESDLQAKTPQNPTPASTGADWFQGGTWKLQFDPNDAHSLYASIVGYGIWRRTPTQQGHSWSQVFHTMNQTDFVTGAGDFFGDLTAFDIADLGTTSRMYLGDASDDWAADGDDSTPLPEAWRSDDIAAVTGSPDGALDNEAAGWKKLSDAANGTNGFLAYGWCQNGQCGYDAFVGSPPGQPDAVFYGGSMNYDELMAYDQYGTGAPPRSNGRAVIRSTNGGDEPTAVTWQDMSATIGDTSKPWDITNGIHPDQHAITFAGNGSVAFIGSDGGVVRLDLSSTQDKSAACSHRTWNYDANDPTATPVPLTADDLLDCERLLNGTPASITALNDGLNTIQFQSLSFNPNNPTGELLGGTQDNGTWSYTGSATWYQSVGGDGGQSGFNPGNSTIRYHNYYDATPEVNFHGNNSRTWLATYDPLQTADESRSFYVPFIADPSVAGQEFIGLQHVWRTKDNGGKEAALVANGCNAMNLNPFRTQPCGDWEPIGADLTGDSFGTDRTGQYVVAVERASSNAKTLWAATRTGRVFITDDLRARTAAGTSGARFFRLDGAGNGVAQPPGRFVSGIAVDPHDPHHAFVSYSGYSAYEPGGHVYEVRYNPSTHAATFKNLSWNLGDQPITGIALHGATGDLFVGTDFGVLRLNSGATHWIDAGSGLPHTAVYGLALSQSAKVLYAATHGRGAYVLKL